jgi:hypothetical protein
MKKYTNIYAMVAILMLLFASCSTEKVEGPIDDTNSQFTNLTFGAVLNDLANKSLQKGHFDQVPTCADAEPAVAVIEFSYGGSDYSATVDILSDASGYFTDYSEDLKIPVPSDGSTNVTVTSFMVYDGDTSVPSDAFYSPIHGNLIWIAPKGDDAQFDGYVEEALPVMFEVFPGTKPYFDIEVLCFDRRVVNEYGYVFFDILPKTVYPLCLFVNYCNVDDRHWVADYSVDLYFGTDATGIQLYYHTNPMAMVATGVIEGEFYADPLCLVIPGPPANLGNDDPYLYLVIYPENWANSYGDIDNTPVPLQLSWNMVNALLNDDGTTNEYLHLLVGECEDARDGDPTIPGGGNGCSLSNPEADCDGDGVLNGVDNCPGFDDNLDLDGDNIPNACDDDRDGDGILNGQDSCPDVIPGGEQVDPDEDGCWTDPGQQFPDNPCNIVVNEGCNLVYPDGNSSFITVGSNFPFELALLGDNSNDIGTVTFNIAGGDLQILANLDGVSNIYGDYGVTVIDDSGDLSVFEFDCFAIEGGNIERTITGDFSYPILVRFEAELCPAN